MEIKEVLLMRIKSLFIVVFLISLSAVLVGCGLLEQVGPSPSFRFGAFPNEAEVGYPITIVISYVKRSLVEVEELSVTAPDGTRYVYQREIAIPEGHSYGITFPSPDWTGSPSTEQKGIYTVTLQYTFVRFGQEVARGEPKTIMTKVTRE